MGREQKLAAFRTLLERPGSPAVLYHSGNAGCGKSRLVIEYRRLAESLEWPVLYVSNRLDADLSARLGGLAANRDFERLLLIWDNWKGEREQQFRDFVNLGDDPTLSGLRVKRVATSWPNFRRSVKAAADATTRIEDRPLEVLDDSALPEIEAFLANLFADAGRPPPDGLRRLVRQAEGYPMALLLGEAQGELEEEIKEGLLSAVDGTVAGAETVGGERLARWAGSILAAGPVEPDPELMCALAGRVGGGSRSSRQSPMPPSTGCGLPGSTTSRWTRTSPTPAARSPARSPPSPIASPSPTPTSTSDGPGRSATRE